jgi:hypothetical protein
MSSSFNLYEPCSGNFCAIIKELAAGAEISSVPDMTNVGIDIFES